MEVSFEPIAEPGEEVIDWITQETWPFHLNVRPTRSEVASWIAGGGFAGHDVESFWAVDGGVRVAMIRLFDLGDLTPLFDLRVAAAYRGEGFGTATLRFGVEHVFTTREQARRFGGYTRFDNLAMRAAFEKLGFTHEARHREAWRTAEGEFVDSVGYAVLRREWLEAKHRYNELRKLTPMFVDRR